MARAQAAGVVIWVDGSDVPEYLADAMQNTYAEIYAMLDASEGKETS